MTYQIATIISCVLFPIFAWLGTWLAKRTIYRPIASEEGASRNEQEERDKVKGIREKSVRKTFTIYGAIVLVVFGMAALAEPVQKVHAALFPTATPTVTSTRTPTRTPTPSRTPSITTTSTARQTNDGSNFLTTLAGTPITGTPRTPTPFLPSGSGGGNSPAATRIVIQTVIVVRTQIVIKQVTQINYYPVTVYVVVTATNTPTPQPTLIVDTASPTITQSPTLSPTPTVTYTPTATPTFTETPTP